MLLVYFGRLELLKCPVKFFLEIIQFGSIKIVDAASLLSTTTAKLLAQISSTVWIIERRTYRYPVSTIRIQDRYSTRQVLVGGYQMIAEGTHYAVGPSLIGKSIDYCIIAD